MGDRLVAPPLAELREKADAYLAQLRTGLSAKAAQIEAEMTTRKNEHDPSGWAQRAGYALARTREGLAAVEGVMAERGIGQLTEGAKAVLAARHRFVETGYDRDVLGSPLEYSGVLIEQARALLAGAEGTDPSLLHVSETEILARAAALLILELDRRAAVQRLINGSAK